VIGRGGRGLIFVTHAVGVVYMAHTPSEEVSHPTEQMSPQPNRSPTNRTEVPPTDLADACQMNSIWAGDPHNEMERSPLADIIETITHTPSRNLILEQ